MRPYLTLHLSIGPFSPQISERCFTYSSQTARGRTLGEEPWSRTVCIRRVFNHEVRRQLDPRWRHPLDPFKAVVPLDIPLPPESRTPISGFLAGPAAPSSPSPNSSTSPPPSRAPFSPSTSISTSARDTSGAEPPHQKYWEPGYYLWLSRSRHATQEHMDLMSRSLMQQAVYERQKQEANETWARAAKRGQAVWYWADSPEGAEGRTDGQAQGATGADAQAQVQGSGGVGDGVPLPPMHTGPPFPDLLYVFNSFPRVRHKHETFHHSDISFRFFFCIALRSLIHRIKLTCIVQRQSNAFDFALAPAARVTCAVAHRQIPRADPDAARACARFGRVGAPGAACGPPRWVCAPGGSVDACGERGHADVEAAVERRRGRKRERGGIGAPV